MSDLSTVDAESFKTLLGEKGKDIRVSWIRALAAAGVTLTIHPFKLDDIKAAISPGIKSLSPVGTLRTRDQDKWTTAQDATH